MKVKKLKKLLNEFPDDLDVMLMTDDHFGYVGKVRKAEVKSSLGGTKIQIIITPKQ